MTGPACECGDIAATRAGLAALVDDTGEGQRALAYAELMRCPLHDTSRAERRRPARVARDRDRGDVLYLLWSAYGWTHAPSGSETIVLLHRLGTVGESGLLSLLDRVQLDEPAADPSRPWAALTAPSDPDPPPSLRLVDTLTTAPAAPPAHAGMRAAA